MIPPWTRPWLLAGAFVALCAVFTADLWLPGRNPTQDAPPPVAPPFRLVARGAEGWIDLSWAPAAGATQYQILRAALASGPFERITLVEGTTFADRGASPGIPWFYRLRSVGADGRLSPPTRIVSATALHARSTQPRAQASASPAPPFPAPKTSARPSLCGDGKPDPGEACDGGGESSSCNVDCTRAVCGDGIQNASAGEQCDDGGTRDEDGCSHDCKSECGNGRMDDREECDDGGESPSCNADCTRSRCGDGVLNRSAAEACDDGNVVPGDGCSPDCHLEK